MKHSHFRALSAAALLGYAALILCYTVLSRPAGFYPAHTALFWSYRAWFAGDRSLGVQILANIALFVPFGLLACAQCRRTAVLKSVCAGLLLSCLVEGLQVLLMRGQFELDDLVNNTLGAALGAFCGLLFSRRARGRDAVLALGAAAVLLGVIACLCADTRGDEYAARHYCLQLEQVSFEDGRIELGGFGFRYGQEPRGARLLLVSAATGKRVPLRVAYGLEREDVSRYFLCDCTRSGFTADGEGLNAGEEYELYAAFGWRIPLPTGVYLRDGELRYVSEAIYRAPENAGSELEALLAEGTALAYLPGLPCWIVQRGAALYWVFPEDYPLEADGSTIIQYGLWSTQTDRLPEDKLHKELGCADLHGDFEKFELSGDFGPFRVMACELPEEYPVTAVLTGYWTRTGGWVWESCFRPVYGWDKLHNEA